MEDLGIARISKSLLEVGKRESKQLKIHSSFKAKKLLETSELRRSSRKLKEAPSYCNDVVNSGKRRINCRRSCKSETVRREYTGRIASHEEKVLALKRGEMLLTQVSSDHPSFVKSMLRSHVSSCFWLGLPTKFCRDHLPLCETKMILEDEEGEEHEAVYIGRRTGLSGGWRSFAVDHKLEDGDALVFKLIELTRFKIYIVKAIVGSTQAKDRKALSIESKETEDSSCENQSSHITIQAPMSKPEDLPRNARKRKQSKPRPAN
ncbi:B3 domain-containing protein Os05g0481400-like isoform X2 [Phalaenopsis equestris]|uniref:B3 domain-containing protein Os05g0481400-like isoform X2 n=1 Tax=Phalaenopsis equestris TaxID=78828 RepID=UPI0009E57CFF|nr:B3 domain-containing protein Os05g0481400-like isoform X2 [Phalaenopsis equestris]